MAKTPTRKSYDDIHNEYIEAVSRGKTGQNVSTFLSYIALHYERPEPKKKDEVKKKIAKILKPRVNRAKPPKRRKIK